MVPDKAFDLVWRTPDLEVIEAASLHFMQKKSLLHEVEATRAQVQLSDARAQSFESRAQRSEEENKGLQTEVKKLQGEIEASWWLGKKKFMQSKEFDTLCLDRSSVYFEHGFNGCLAQFMENGYFEYEHPTFFLDVVQALADMPKEDEILRRIARVHSEPPHPDVYIRAFNFLVMI
ncbi:hypothetical protein F511_10726 [Dorcoceras hygrometricum]|uniref:Uncharacterized protein n=1 Tax=Dorcoceras hygrometricum TaxID=472368 RepID=A0A2Z7CB37_9LAMI|nr:hypothetical protein F511_10726 [Dorcoceras hygrometricum]